MTRRAAWLAIVVAVAGCAPAAATPAPEPAAAGDFAGPVDIGGGRFLYLECHGSGVPTVILESGYHDSSDPWSLTDAVTPAAGPAVLPALATDHRVCAYDRPGTLRYTDPPTITDRSSPVVMPRTAGDIVADLHALLIAAEVSGPYVLVAHSLGGLFGRLYAQTYPAEVSAVVFVDAFPVQIPALMGAQWPAYRQLLDHPLPEFADDPAFEVVDIDASVAQVGVAPPMSAIPLAVLTKTEPFAMPPNAPPQIGPKLETAWITGAHDLVALGSQTPQTMATGSDHYIQVHQPDLVTEAVNLVVHRTNSPR